MPIIAALATVALILVILWDAFETVILPRRVRRHLRLATAFYRVTWAPWSALARRIRTEGRRESFLSVFGPLSLLFLLAIWALGLIFGFATLQWSLGSHFRIPEGQPNFGTDLYFSGITFFTVGFGDVAPITAWERILSVIEGGMGFGFLALVLSYLPVLYQAFSRREVNVSLLDARAGSPPTAGELLRRHGVGCPETTLADFLRDWERWSAELLESHLSYPALSYFRSQHDNESWLGALTVILDTCALIQAGVNGVPRHQARLTFAMARHAAVDLSQVVSTPRPRGKMPQRLPPEELTRLRETLAGAGMALRDGEEALTRLEEYRAMYEPFVWALSDFLLSPLPAWLPASGAIDDWESSPQE